MFSISRLVYSQKKPFVLVFDDLTVDKYQVVYDSLDMEDLKMVIDKTAKYHALSLVLLQNGLNQVTQFEASLNPAMAQLFAPMEIHLQNIGKIVSTWPGYEQIGEKLLQNGPKIPGRFLSADRTIREDRFFVLNHGDFHIRNLMFQKSDGGRLSNVIFLDFQMPAFFSASLDLIGVLNAMGNADVRRRSPEVIKQYHGQLVANLKLYGYEGKIPSVIDIEIELLKCSDYHAFSSLLAIPMFKIRGIEMAELFNTNEDSPSVIGIREAFTDPEFIADIKPLLYSFYNRGVFDE